MISKKLMIRGDDMHMTEESSKFLEQFIFSAIVGIKWIVMNG